MGLAKNLYRRQAIYWWRRRFAVAGCTRTIAISLRVQNPVIARWIADALNARAHCVARRLELRMSSLSTARQELVTTVEGFVFALDESAVASLDALIARGSPRFESNTRTLSSDEEHHLLVAMGREAGAELARTAGLACAQSLVDDPSKDPTTQSILADKALAVVYRTLARSGTAGAAGATRDLAAQRDALSTQFSTDMLGFIGRETEFHAKRETMMGWSLGPPRAYFEKKMRELGVDPSPGAVRLLRRNYLLVVAELLEKPDHRYRPTLIADVLRDLSQPVVERVEPGLDAVGDMTPIVAKETKAPPPPKIEEKVSVSIGTPHKTIAEYVEGLARQNIKAGAWQQKTADQHHSLARMFTKVVGSENPRDIRQDHIGAFRALLDDLPKNWGKSPSDAQRTIEDIVARAQDLDEEEVGLSPGTIDRQLTQLSNILAHLRGHGFTAGEVTSNMRTGGKSQQRGVFSAEELAILFASPVWTGCTDANDRLTPGPHIIRDALYWVPLLGHYQLGRLHELCGLRLDDIDFGEPALLIRDNSERSLKSEGSHRRSPLVPELIRLGFLGYCRQLAAEGHVLVFPCLRRRGSKTPLSNLFYKEFRKTLNLRLPLASRERKSFHSLRKAGNTAMVNANINDALRHAVMGHAHSGTNEKHYIDVIHDSAKRTALASISVTTAHFTTYQFDEL